MKGYMAASNAAVRALVSKGALVPLVRRHIAMLAVKALIPRRRLALTPTMLQLSSENKAPTAGGYTRQARCVLA